jgi:hypothetical protein
VLVWRDSPLLGAYSMPVSTFGFLKKAAVWVDALRCVAKMGSDLLI